MKADYMVIKKKDKIQIVDLQYEFEDDFTTIHLSSSSAKKRGILGPTIFCKSDSHYNLLDSLILKVNLFKPRLAIPDKKVYFNVYGKSKLIRDRATGIIKLVYRKQGNDKGLSTEGGWAQNANTCYISDLDSRYDSSWGFYRNAYRDDRFGFYYMDRSCPDYEYWNNYMDEAYAELAGNTYMVKNTRPFKPIQDKEKREMAEMAYAWTRTENELELIKDLAIRGLCKMDKEETCIYDKNGYFICEVSEQKEKEGNGEIICEILDWLNNDNLRVFCDIANNYIDGLL